MAPAPYRRTEIRQRGPLAIPPSGAPVHARSPAPWQPRTKPWCDSLASISIADLATEIDADSDGTALRDIDRWLTPPGVSGPRHDLPDPDGAGPVAGGTVRAAVRLGRGDAGDRAGQALDGRRRLAALRTAPPWPPAAGWSTVAASQVTTALSAATRTNS